MNLYIKVIDGVVVDHPIVEENLLGAFQLAEITPQFLAEQNLVRFEKSYPEVGSVLLSKDGYEIGADGIVRDKLITQEMTQEEKLDEWVRRPRSFFLAKSDWTQMPDAPLTAEKKAEWAAYRQELRDMTTTYANIQNPSEIVPPVEPTK